MNTLQANKQTNVEEYEEWLSTGKNLKYKWVRNISALFPPAFGQTQ